MLWIVPLSLSLVAYALALVFAVGIGAAAESSEKAIVKFGLRLWAVLVFMAVMLNGLALLMVAA